MCKDLSLGHGYTANKACMVVEQLARLINLVFNQPHVKVTKLKFTVTRTHYFIHSGVPLS